MWLFLLICTFCLVDVNKSQETDLNVNITQLFVHKISPDKWNEKEREHDFHYTITSLEGPDIPPWLHVKHTKKNNNFFIFGAAPKDLDIELLELQISITSLYNYRTKYVKLKIWFNSIDEYPKHEIQLRISNLDIEEMLKENGWNGLIEIFEENFWKLSTGKLFVTYLVPSDYVSYQLPSNPNDTSGVVIHLGSIANFSEELFDLQNETLPLTKHCPSLYKRITVDRFFRPKNLIIDWCSFRLVNLNDCDQSSSSRGELITSLGCKFPDNNPKDNKLNHDKEFLILKETLPQSPVHGMITLFVIVPSLCFGLIIILWLSSFMCFNNKKLNDPYSDDYFDTIFFVCQDLIRKEYKNNEPTFMENNRDDELLFHF